MLVAIDVGNTDVKLALVRDGRVLVTRRAPTRGHARRFDAEGLLVDATGADRRTTRGVEGVAAVSVVPAWTEAIVDLAARLGVPLLLAGPDTIPMPSRVADRGRVGADRLLDAYAAARLHGTPAIVVDLGTATTVDAVDAEGAFVGGAIAAGLELGLGALASGTAQLPRVPLVRPERAIGRDTAEAMQSGAIHGHVGLLHELIERVASELVALAPSATRPRVVVTGGLSNAAWIELLQGVDVVDPELTLRGLAVLHAEVATAVAT